MGDTGAEREIGRFGIFPNAEFKAAEPSKAQRFGLALPKELARGGPGEIERLSGSAQGGRQGRASRTRERRNPLT